MAIFDNPFFRSKDKNTEEEYTKGVLCIQKNDFYGAERHLRPAANSGHISALYNLSIIVGSGLVSPYDIQFATDCFRKAAVGGHPKAKEFSSWLDKAGHPTLGPLALNFLVETYPASSVLNHVLVMVACEHYSALCKNDHAEEAVIKYELDAASRSDHDYIQTFVRRTGITQSVYSGGLNILEEGSAADKITDGLNQLYIGLKRSGHSDKLCLLMRCTIVGHIISNSKYASSASPLLGADKFFE